MKCRSCGGPCEDVIDLGMQPPSNAFLVEQDQAEKVYPLKAVVCLYCWLMQVDPAIPAEELFGPQYVYFSSQCRGWVAHTTAYCEMARKRFGLNKGKEPQLLGNAGSGGGSVVIEIGGNDGSLLAELKDHVTRAINIEPSASVAAQSSARGVETWVEYWHAQQIQADLIIANNVLAHTPDLNGFASSLFFTLKPAGTATIEFPHVLNLINEGQFDTIYHEHYSYLSITALDALFARHRLAIYDVEQLPTHGGSLRIYVHRSDSACPAPTDAVWAVRRAELKLTQLETYKAFAQRAADIKKEFWQFMRGKKSVVGYGAAAKGNTFLNYVGASKLPYVADTTPAKIGKFLPGSRIPVVEEDHMLADEPEYAIILPWNWANDIVERIGSSSVTKFVTFIPKLKIW